MITKSVIVGAEELRDQVIYWEKRGYEYMGHTQICEHCMRMTLYFLKDATDDEIKLVNTLLTKF